MKITESLNKLSHGCCIIKNCFIQCGHYKVKRWYITLSTRTRLTTTFLTSMSGKIVQRDTLILVLHHVRNSVIPQSISGSFI